MVLHKYSISPIVKLAIKSKIGSATIRFKWSYVATPWFEGENGLTCFLKLKSKTLVFKDWQLQDLDVIHVCSMNAWIIFLSVSFISYWRWTCNMFGFKIQEDWFLSFQLLNVCSLYDSSVSGLPGYNHSNSARPLKLNGLKM